MSHLTHVCGAALKHVWQAACRLRRPHYSVLVSLSLRDELLSLISACLIFVPSVLSVSFVSSVWFQSALDWLRAESQSQMTPRWRALAAETHARGIWIHARTTGRQDERVTYRLPPLHCNTLLAVCVWVCVSAYDSGGQSRNKAVCSQRTWVWLSVWWSTKWSLIPQFFCFTPSVYL